jgi:hypothetical protein
MSFKNNILTNFLAHAGATISSLTLTLGLGFSGISLIKNTINYCSALPKSMDPIVNTIMGNSIIGVIVIGVLLIVSIVSLSEERKLPLELIFKISTITSVTAFIVIAFIAGLQMSDVMTTLMHSASIWLGIILIALALCSIRLAFIQKPFFNKLNIWSAKCTHFFKSKKQKKEQVKAKSYLKEMSLNTEEKINESKLDEIKEAFKNIKAHLNIENTMFKSDSKMHNNINHLESNIHYILEHSVQEANLADVKSLMFKSLPEIALAYKEIDSEPYSNSNETQKSLVLNTIEEINQYFDSIVEKTKEEKLQAKTEDLSVKLEFAKKRFLNATQ